MENLYMYRKTINEDSVFVQVQSSEVEKIATEVQESLKLCTLNVLGLVEVASRDKAREELIKQGLSTSPKYTKPITAFYSGLIKDELLTRLV